MPEKRPRSEPSEDVLEKNIARLLAHADRPPVMSGLAERRLRERLHRELPRVAARAPARSVRTALAPLAAAVLLAAVTMLIAGRDETRTPACTIVASEGRIERLDAETGRWEPLGDTDRVAVGDGLLVLDGTLTLDDGTGGRLTLHRGRVDVGEERLRLELGEGTWDAPPRARGAIETPLALLRATGAKVRIRVDGRTGRDAPVGPTTDPGEGNEMNGRTIATVGGGILVIVTAVVLWTGDDPVDVEHGGETTSLEEGDTARIDGESGVTVTSGRTAARVADRPRGSDIPAASDPDPEGELRTVEVTVVDPTGAPVTGAGLAYRAGPMDEGAEEDSSPAAERRAATDDEGRAELRFPAHWAELDLTVTADRHPDTVFTWVDPAILLAEGANPSPEETLPADGTPPVDSAEPWIVTLPFETAITGRITLLEDGEPASGALIGVQRITGPNQWHDPVLRDVEEEDGSYYVGGISPGRYSVWAYRAGAYRTETLQVDVAEGQRLEGNDLVLAPGASAIATVYEKVSGNPIAGAVVYPHVDHLPGTVDFVHRGEFIDERVRNVGRTGPDGVVRLDDLPPRRTMIRLVHPDFRTKDLWIEPGVGDELELEFALEGGPSIVGEVIDENGDRVNGTAILAVTMALDPTLSQVDMVPVTDGRYEVPNVSPGNYVVIHQGDAPGMDAMQMKFAQVPAGEDAVVDFVAVANLATLRGTVFHTDGTPVGRTFVSVSTVDDQGEVRFESGMSDAEGMFEFRNLELREWGVFAAPSPESMVAIGEVTLEQPIDYEEEFTLPDGQVLGTVTDEDGAPVPGLEVFIFLVAEGEEPEWNGRSVSGADGTFAFVGVTEGTYSVFSQGVGLRQQFSTPFTLEEGGTVTHDIVVRTGGTVRVIATDVAGNAAGGLRVRILDAEGAGVNDGLPARTDDRGAYSFQSLAPGEYRVVLLRDGELLPGEASFTARMGETVEVRLSVP